MKLIRDIPNIYCDLIEEGLHKPHNDRLTVTELVNPPLIKHLQIKYWDKLETKASEYLWMILGNAVHKVFESSGLIRQLKDLIGVKEQSCVNYAMLTELQNIIDGHFAEKPVEITVAGVKIKGRIDFRETGIIRDFKVTSVWSFMGGMKPEWEAQDNIYRFMSIRNGIPVDRLLIDAILRDWKIVETFRNKDYPKMPFVSLEVPIWDDEKTYNYILERIAAYKAEPCECSAEEKWQKQTTYAVKKPKAKRATRVFNTLDETHKYIEEYGKKRVTNIKLEIEVRPGECTRCLHYCPVRKVCPFVKREN